MQPFISFQSGENSDADGHQQLCAQAGIAKNIFFTITGERLLPLPHSTLLNSDRFSSTHMALTVKSSGRFHL